MDRGAHRAAVGWDVQFMKSIWILFVVVVVVVVVVVLARFFFFLNCAKRGIGMHKHHRNNQMAHLHHAGNGGVSWDVMGAQGISLICGGAQGRARSECEEDV